MLRILGVLSIVFTFHKEQRVKTKWLRTLIKLKIVWLQKFGWDAVLQLGMKFNNCKKKKKKPHTANGKLLGSFISPLIQRYWIYIVPTQYHFTLSSLPVWKQNQKTQYSISPHYHKQKFTSLSLISSSLNRNEIIITSSRILFPKWYKVILHHMIQKAVLLRFTLINRHFTSRADKQFQVHFQFSIGDGIPIEIYLL